MAQLSDSCTNSGIGTSIKQAVCLPEHIPLPFPKLLDNMQFSH